MHKLKILLLLVVSGFSAFSWARLTDGQFQLQLQGTEIVGSIENGFHFNKEAPASLKSEDGQIQRPPTTKEEKKIVFNTASIANKANFTLSFYICDDKKTVCEPHEDIYQIVNKKLVLVKSLYAQETPVKVDNAAYTEALSKAAEQKKLVLLDFAAPWCPACLRLETETFPTDTFKNAVKDFIVLKVNVDQNQNETLAKKYSVMAIPTLILVNADGQELYRNLDFKVATKLAQELTDVSKGHLATTESLQLAAEGGDKAAMKELGLRYFNTLKFAEAVKWLGNLKEDSLLYANAETSLAMATADKNKTAATAILEKWIQKYPDSLDSIEWRNEWADLSMDGKKKPGPRAHKMLNENIKLINLLLAKYDDKSLPAASYQDDVSGFEKAELYEQLSHSYELAKDSDKAQEVNAKISIWIEAKNLNVSRPGEVLTAVHYLRKSGAKAPAASWLKKLVDTYPSNPVYYLKLASFYNSEKDYQSALPYAQKAVSLSADKPLLSYKELAKTQQGLHLKEAAQQTLDKALALPDAKLETNKEITESLTKMKQTL